MRPHVTAQCLPPLYQGEAVEGTLYSGISCAIDTLVYAAGACDIYIIRRKRESVGDRAGRGPSGGPRNIEPAELAREASPRSG